MATGTPAEGALAGLRILDLTDERGIYGGKLLADLGADVVRPEPPAGDPLRTRGPHVDDTPAPDSSLYWAFFASNRRSVTIDAATPDGRGQLAALAAWADIVLDCGALAAAGIDSDALIAAKPALVVVRVSSFGQDGPWKDYLAPDLVAAALGGFAATTGDIDTPPLKGFGELNFITSGTYAAIGALTALRHARETGQGQIVDVPVHETIASCLEQVLMWWWYGDRVGPVVRGKVLPRRAALHWSDLYDVFNARDGAISATPMPDIQKQIAWLVEEDAFGDLLDPELAELKNFRRLIDTLMHQMSEWIATKDAEPLMFEAQERHRPFGTVLPLDKVAENPHLAAREWWQTYRAGGREVRGPGAPYHLSETPWAIDARDATLGADTETVLREIGWGA